MNTAVIQRQYDELIAERYDQDPHGLTGASLDRAIAQIEQAGLLSSELSPLRMLDLGMGTGLFCEKLRFSSDREIAPYGIDISAKMIEVAQQRLPDLIAETDDAANVDRQFVGETFDLLCTHFITGFVPIDHLAPRIHDKLEDGGYWSFVGGTSAAFPGLQKRANSREVRWLFGAGKLDVSEATSTPADEHEVSQTMLAHGFELCTCETFRPQLDFPKFADFMRFGYEGGWLTPFIEEIGLHKCGPVTRALINTLFFPMRDHHDIVIALARKV
ncbi:MAG: class I SAM-dependent methyltransferase [Planctomycetota bacterium]|nr:MAG: class I SAM-dependent methyltransferase [Planctomycetota bacterium]REJ93521.1 MAG: class I SAM-dependent methyltransferase [Planctomycetota bacterium]REK24687.1 MAG: class I SAM-dependent methyltransferase [Planctomycetota bacterium]REK40186.1 MAG: class I SAM-dependent methyltransferase [Planctomycetota bacterium]